MTRVTICLALCGFCLIGTARAHAQQIDPAAIGGVTVPRLVNFSGVVKDQIGTARTSGVALTFALYEEQEGRTPLWQETQIVQPDGQGRYTVQLGAATPGGLPLDLFTSGKALWLGIQEPSVGSVDQSRVQLSSVPYALKASDAETLGGKAASSFVTQEELSASIRGGVSSGVSVSGTSSTSTASSNAVQPLTAGSETTNYIPKWANNTGDFGNSVMYQSGGNIGIGTTTPREQLELTSNIRLPVTTAATGIIYKGDAWFSHTFAGLQGNNTFLGNYAGNFTMGGVNAWDGTANTGIGARTLLSLTTGLENTAVGAQALTFNTIGTDNIAVGDQALYKNTGGGANVSIGHLALYENLTGNYNTAVGHAALQYNTGSVNTALGDEALWRNTSGGANTAVGAETLWTATTGSENTSMGYQSLINQTEADYNTAYGSRALSLLTTGSTNTAFGAFAGRTDVDANANITGSSNVWVGYQSGPGTPTQLNNSIAIGYLAKNTSSNQVVLGNSDITETLLRGNVGIGTTAPQATLEVDGTAKFDGLVTFADGQTFPGTTTGVTAGTGLTGGGTGGMVTLSVDTTKVPQLATANTFTGNQTMTGTLAVDGTIQSASNLFLTSSNAVIYRGGVPFVHAFKPVANDGFNTFLGTSAGNLTMGGASAWFGSYNTGVGFSTLRGTTTGYDNTALGYVALGTNTTGYKNTAVGANAMLLTTTGGNNTAVGSEALLFNTTGNYNTGVGLQTLYRNTFGEGNAGVGDEALNHNTTGNYNTCVGGAWCLWTNTTGSSNSGFGTQALFLNTTGNSNTAIGGTALSSNTTGSRNVAVGSDSGHTLMPANANVSGSNNVWIGAEAGPGTTTQLTNAIAIGYNALNTKSNQAVIGNTSVTETLLHGNVGIGTTAPGATLEVNGTAKFDGFVTFADGQVFPGVGTITGVSPGTGLSGGGSSGTVTLNNTGILTVGVGPGITTTAGQSPTLGIDTAVVPELGLSNLFTTSQFISTNSTTPALYVENSDSTNAHDLAFQVTGPSFGGNCTIDVSGNLACTGTKSAVVSVDSGSRRVALYAVEAPENWFEDYGTGRLASGVTTIALESVWAQTVNTGMEYHVFLTPKGDCEGLYVTNETPTGFEVRELHHGTSDVAFDYRVIARRKGYETTRLVDLTRTFTSQPVLPPASKRVAPEK